jgi:hypothetical protein
MLSVGGSWDLGDTATLLLMPGLAAYAVAVVIALGLWIWSRRGVSRSVPATGRGGDAQLLASARAKEHRDLALIALAPLLIVIIAPGLLVAHAVVAIVALVVFLLIASMVFRQLLRVISGTA